MCKIEHDLPWAKTEAGRRLVWGLRGPAGPEGSCCPKANLIGQVTLIYVNVFSGCPFVASPLSRRLAEGIWLDRETRLSLMG